MEVCNIMNLKSTVEHLEKVHQEIREILEEEGLDNEEDFRASLKMINHDIKVAENYVKEIKIICNMYDILTNGE